VELTGPQSQAEIAKCLAHAAVFALPCTREADGGMDNLPTVIMEAMACGLPVVSTRIAGVPEMVVENKTGQLVGEDDAAAFAEALDRMLKDPELAKQLGREGREIAVERFSTGATTRELKHLLVRRGRVLPPRSAITADPRVAAQLLRRWSLLD
jgi:glycosyltransferase involved in cell wall biosynthesis